MPSTEACFFQGAHPGETGQLIFMAAIVEHSDLSSFIGDSEVVVDPRMRYFFFFGLCFLPSKGVQGDMPNPWN